MPKTRFTSSVRLRIVAVLVAPTLVAASISQSAAQGHVDDIAPLPVSRSSADTASDVPRALETELDVLADWDAEASAAHRRAAAEADSARGAADEALVAATTIRIDIDALRAVSTDLATRRLSQPDAASIDAALDAAPLASPDLQGYLLGRVGGTIDEPVVQRLRTLRAKLVLIDAQVLWLTEAAHNAETDARQLEVVAEQARAASTTADELVDQTPITDNPAIELISTVELIEQVTEVHDDARREARVAAGQLQTEAEVASQGRAAFSAVPDVDGVMEWPVPGPIDSPFGYRIHPISRSTRYHTGMDIDGQAGDPVTAAGAGTVVEVGWQGGYGNTVVIDHGDAVTTLSAHLSSTSVAVGQVVDEGDVIGRVGATGYATGSHLHFEVLVDDVPVDPMVYLR